MAAGSWTVVRQVPDQYDFTNAGDPVLGTIVYFLTGDGNNGSVFVPNAQYKKAVIQAMLAAAAKVLDDVGRLNGAY